MIDAAHLSPWLLVVAPLVIVTAYTVFGLSGFGSTIISVPILAHFLPVSYLVPLMATLDCASSIFMGATGRRHISRPELKSLLPFMFVGVVIGATVLIGIPDAYLRTALGVFAVAVGVYSIANPVVHRRVSRLWCVPTGIAGGLVSTVFGAGGPIYATYVSGRLSDKTEIRSTLSTLISVSAFSRLVVYAVTGLLLNARIFVGMLLLGTFAWLGLKLGDRIHVGLTQQQMRRAVGTLLLATGASLLWRAFVP